MTLTRRSVVKALALGTASVLTRPTQGAAPVRLRGEPATSPERFDPWIEVDAGALRHNASQIRGLAGRPVLAVIKNNAYGLGLARVGRVLDDVDEVVGCAVVKTEAAIALRDAGFRKPVLLMGIAADDAADDLVRREVRFALCRRDDARRIDRWAARHTRAVHAHFYVDTGMGRMGMPYREALPWMRDLLASRSAIVEGTFTALTEDAAFDRVQLERLETLAKRATDDGLAIGPLHAASSHALFFNRGAHLDTVRPGLALYGAFPAGAVELGLADLRLAFSLKARVVRVERLAQGDGVSYGRNYVAKRPTWVATLPVGHADGYPRAAVEGCEVLIGGRLFPAIGAVSASHTIVELGDDRLAEIGDVATLIGPDDPAISPNEIATRAGLSVYDVLMHLNPGLPRLTARPA